MGTYAIIYLKKAEKAAEVNELLKNSYQLEYETFNGVEYGVFFTEEMFEEDLRFMNEDEEGKKNLPHYKRPISRETYHSLLFGAGNCFGEIGTACFKISCVDEKDMQYMRALKAFIKNPVSKTYINFKKSKHLQDFLRLK
ncbi:MULTISPECIES: hypothetical protein [Weeksellaceae]|uniref:hypothetical protein n=1 Tax=Weeksellaceae TaxID=2762318 RepID=UPI000999C238|nr:MULTISPECIES: hypothetical protein [Weeksellaceae]MDV3547210.1 hypothetical protein [Elizabethkingia anophelis]MDV3564973.1 hypothetical protein [Elizabethkingia anophelis]MDV3610601.1 hypothetical protein [Elizabethkingia anophelis]MDV3626317.1 hypothetical protein [Elizabethkingia anophelis]MDV3644018.1 hypothetical protein [Elizabethkingia anophelis]